MTNFFEEEIVGNLNHIGRLLRFLIKTNKTESIYNLIYYNTVFQMLEYLYNKEIYRTIETLLDF